MSPDELAERIRAAQEAAYDQAIKDQRHNDWLPRVWRCRERHRPGDHSTVNCALGIAKGYATKGNPYRKS